MRLKVGLKAGDLVNLNHKEVVVSGRLLTLKSGSSADGGGAIKHTEQKFRLTAHDSVVLLSTANGWQPVGHLITVDADKPDGLISIKSAGYDGIAAKSGSYKGRLEILAQRDRLRLILVTDLESYVQGVLQSEVPASFHAEALKAQAVVARSYGLHPRLPHTADGFDVCDSFLHCQAFAGVQTLTPAQSLAISETKNQVVLFQGKPALALFSACAGGHTEDYSVCFSDPITNAFPPPAIPYLKGVPEGKLPEGFPSEAAMRKLFVQASPQTDDAWSKGSFRWQVRFTADALESYMHHVVEQLQTDADCRLFIKQPGSGKFGHIKKFEIEGRGVAGTAIRMLVHTSTGIWTIEKELVIRKAFSNPQLGLKRLKSARIFFDHAYDSNGLLSTLVVFGFGSGHGVGLQQVGAQGLATRGATYLDIINHYYPGTHVGKSD